MLKLVVLAVLFVAVMGEAPQQGGGPPPAGHPPKRIVRDVPEGIPGGMNPMGSQGGSFPGMPPGTNPADMAKKMMDTAQNFASSVMSGRRRRNV